MGKVGRHIDDPRSGGEYFIVTLDSGDQIEVFHQRGRGRFSAGVVTIDLLKHLGFTATRLYACHLDSDEGRNVVTLLIRDASHGGLEASPLTAFVEYIKDSQSVAEVKAQCDALRASR